MQGFTKSTISADFSVLLEILTFILYLLLLLLVEPLL